MLIDLQGVVVGVYPESKSLRVRILHIHGLPDADATASDKNRTEDKYLPIIPYDIPAGVSPETAIGTGGYEVGAVVRITCSDGTIDSARAAGVIYTAQQMKQSPLNKWWKKFVSVLSNAATANATTSALDSAPTYRDAGVSDDSVPNANPAFKDYFGLPYSKSDAFVVTSTYGFRDLNGAEDYHLGIDLSANDGSPIYAVGDGTIVHVFSNWSESCGRDGMMSYGNCVTIRHAEKDGQVYYTHYAHMSGICDGIKEGDPVQGTQSGHEGTQLGWQGNTGNSFGSHLHFEVLTGVNHNKDTTHNPENYIQFRAAAMSSGSYGENARKLWAFGKAYDMDDYHCAGMLGNINHESGIDPTSVEAIYDEPFKIGTRKSPLFSGNTFTKAMNVYAESLPQFYAERNVSIIKDAYAYEDPADHKIKYAAGLGLIGFTGQWSQDVLSAANDKSRHWYDLDIQVYEMLAGQHLSRFMTYCNHPVSNVYEACAAWFSFIEFGLSEVVYTGIGMDSRQNYSQYWYDMLKNTSQSEYADWANTIKGWLSN